MTRAQRIESLRKSSRQWLWLLAFYALGLLARDLHFSQSRHVPCEHGAVEHSDSAIEPGGSGIAGPVLRENPATHESGHHHCPIAKPALVTSIDTPRAAQQRAPAGAPREQLSANEPRAPRIAVFRIAPHHSPPAV